MAFSLTMNTDMPCVHRSRLLGSLLSVLLVLEAAAATRSWNNAAGGAWNVPENWTPSGVPNPSDTVGITLAGDYTVTLTADATLAQLTLGGGTGRQSLNVSAGVLKATTITVAAQGELALSGGGVSGDLTVLANGDLHLASPGNISLYQLTLLNQGTVTWSGGDLLTGQTPSTTVTNEGLWLITSDASFRNVYGGPNPRFVNLGTVRKTAGTGRSLFSTVQFLNQGAIEIQSGILEFATNLGTEFGGTVDVAAGATFRSSGGSSLEAGGVFTGEGTRAFTGGLLTLRTNILVGLALTGGDVAIGPDFQQAGAITNLAMAGSRLIGTNRVGGGVLTVSGGELTGALTVQPGGELVVAGPTSQGLYQFELLNQGTVTWSGGDLLTGQTPSTTVTNQGLWLISSDASFRNVYGGPNPRFVNLGTLRKTAGTGRSLFNTVQFLNQGAIEVQAGTLELGANLASELGGTVDVATGATFRSSSGSSLEAGGIFTGAGTRAFTGGLLTLRTNILVGLALTGGDVAIGPDFQQAGAITNLTLAGTRLIGTNRVGTGVLTFNGGDLTGALTVQPDGELVLAGPGSQTFYQLSLLNQGTVTWSGGDLLTGQTPSTTVTNEGLWLISSDASFRNVYGGPNPRFVNLGTLRKTAGTGRSLFNTVQFLNQGAIEVQSGTLELGANLASELGGTVEVAAGATFRSSGGTSFEAGGVFTGEGTRVFTGGTLTLLTNILAGLTLTGGDLVVSPGFQGGAGITNLTLTGGALTGTNRVGPGVLRIEGGSLTGLLTVEAGGELVLAGPANTSMYQFTLINQGTVTWAGGDLLTGQTPSTTVTNQGLWLITSDASFRNVYGGPNPRFVNLGTVRKTAGTGRSLFNTVQFLNQGAIEVQAGTIELGANLASELGGTVEVSAGATFRSSGGTSLEAGGVFSGDGTRGFTGGLLTLRTNILVGLALTGGDIEIGPDFQQAGAITNLTLAGSRLIGTNQVGTGVLTLNGGDLTGMLTVQAGGELALAGPGNQALYQFTLVNQGQVTWSGGDLLTGQTPSTTITNSGLWLAVSANALRQVYGGPTPLFVNLGTLRKETVTGRSLFSGLTFLNPGTIEVAAGTLELSLFTNELGSLRLLGGRLQAAGTLGALSGQLQGTGEVGAFQASDTSVVSPGTNGPGQLTFLNGLTLTNSAKVSVDLNGTMPGAEHDSLLVHGAVRLQGSRLEIQHAAALPVGTSFVILDNDGADAVQGTFEGLADGALFLADGRLFRIWYGRGSGNDVVVVRDDGGVLLQSAGLMTNGLLRFQGRGTNAALYTIFAATNLVDAPWEVVGTATADPGGLFQFIDPQPPQYSMRFYISLGP